MRVLRGEGRGQSGFVLVGVIVVTVSLSVIATSVYVISMSTQREERVHRELDSVDVVADAGTNQALARLRRGVEEDLGSAEQPIELAGGEYWVDVERVDDVVTLVSSARENGRASRAEMVVRVTSESVFQWGAFGDVGVTLDSNATVDSYDSSSGDYESQEVNKDGNDTWANESAPVGSNASIELDGNTVVHGDAEPGPASSTTTAGNSAVTGSTAPLSEPFVLPTITVPTIASAGDYTVPGSGSASLGSGDQAYDAFHVDGNAVLEITGPATIVVESFVIDSNAQVLIDSTNGPVEFYVEGDFILNSNTLFASKTYSPEDLSIKLLSDNIIDPDLEVDLDVVDFDSNAKLYGTIVAPDAYIEINSNFELFGALVAHQVHLDSNSKIHYDEALATSSSSEEIGLELVAWRRLGNVD